MKKFLAILLIALLTFQAIHCQVEDQSAEIPEVEINQEQGGEAEVEVQIEEEAAPEEENVETEAENEAEVEVGGTEVEVSTEENLDGWEVLNTEEFLQDMDNIKIIDFGSQFVIADQKGQGQLPNSTISVDEVYNIHHNVDEDGYDLYRFNLTIGAGDSDTRYLTQYTVQANGNRYIIRRVTTYSIWSDYPYYENGQDLVDRLKVTWLYTNDSYVNQRYSASGELKSETLDEPWMDVVTGQFVGDDVLVKQWAQDSAEAAIPKALADVAIDAGDWSVDSTDYWKYSDNIFGTVYYRFTFTLLDSTNNLNAYGYAFGAFPQGGSFAPYTSGVYSLEDVVENG